MARVISVHEYILKPGVDEGEFERAIEKARERGLLRLRGLMEYYLLRGIRGSRHRMYAAVWIYENKEAWEGLWGPASSPRDKADYPENWRIWEDEILAPFLSEDPDKVEFTAYEEF